MQVVGQLAGGVAHDFNNLLTAIAAYAAMAERKLSPEHEVLPLQKGILDAVDRASALIKQLLIFSRRDTASLEVVDVNRVVVGSSELLRRMIGTDIELVMTPHPTPLHIEVDPSQFEQVLINLAVNARDAMPDGGKLTVAVGQHTAEDFADDPILPPGEYVKLAVSDNGIGMSIEVRDRVFEPFYTTKEIGKGTGLGLSTCFGIVKENGGDIRVKTAPGAGTTFDVYLPVTAKPGPVFADLPPDEDHPFGMETILLVEDEAVVRDLASSALREQGYTVVEASNGEEALRAAEVYEGKIHMVLTDMVMPRMGGKELTQRIKERWPDTPVMLMSGYTGEESLSQETPLLNKPFIIGEMLSMVRQALVESARSLLRSNRQLDLWPDEEK
jgi:CheY-like chemotaxis protein